MAPGNDAFQEMQRRRPQPPVQPLSQEVLDFEPEVPIQLDQNIFLESLKSAPRGSSPGSGGWTYEHLKAFLDDTDTFHLLLSACNSLAQARVPREIAQALMGARLTALIKPDGGVRRIATGCSWRRLVAKMMAKQFVKVFEAECSPFLTHCQRGRGLIASATCCVLQSTQDRPPPSSVRTTTFTGPQC